MKPKNTICLWVDKEALDAERFYATSFPNSKVTAIHKTPADCPSGKAGDVPLLRFRFRLCRSIPQCRRPPEQNSFLGGSGKYQDTYVDLVVTAGPAGFAPHIIDPLGYVGSHGSP
jgi:hypothetical protein